MARAMAAAPACAVHRVGAQPEQRHLVAGVERPDRDHWTGLAQRSGPENSCAPEPTSNTASRAPRSPG